MKIVKTMDNRFPEITEENKALTHRLEVLRSDFLDLFTRHKEMVENDSDLLTSLYLEKLGRLQLELLEKQTEANRLAMKMKLIQAAINRNVQPDLLAIEKELNKRLQDYYARIEAQTAALDKASSVLQQLLPEEEAQKLKEIFRLLCKRLHPDLNPNQPEEDKELFIKVKAAYDLRRISDLQSILLYLDDSKKEQLLQISKNEKAERIGYLEKQIEILNEKIAQLKQRFPFTFADLISDEAYISQRQDELRSQIKEAEDEIIKYRNIINIMTNE